MIIPYFDLDEKVKVQVLNLITTGTIERQEVYITKQSTMVKYQIWTNKDWIEVEEDFLRETQKHEVGTIL